MIRPQPKRVLVLGEGAPALALATTIARLPGVVSVRQQARYTVGEMLPDAHVCIEMLGGLSMGYAAAMQALAQGMGLVVGSSVLAATHGALLEKAAHGQGAFFACAAHGMGSLPYLLQSLQASAVTVLSTGAAQQTIARLVARQETPAVAEHQLRLRGTDFTDLSGKQTHTQAHALLGAWQSVWLNPTKQTRVGIDNLSPSMLPLLNSLGLQLAYGTEVSAASIFTGPMALASTLPPLTEGRVRAYAITAAGGCTLEIEATEGQQSALLAAVQAYLAGQRRRVSPMANNMIAPTLQVQPPRFCLLVGPRSLKAEALKILAAEKTNALLAQEFNGNLWAGVIEHAAPAIYPEEILVLPVAFGYQAGTRLRLVG